MLVSRMSGSPVQSNLLSLFQLLPLERVMYPVSALFLLVGVMVGTTASLLSISKHLRV
jgi:hypothetical protein